MITWLRIWNYFFGTILDVITVIGVIGVNGVIDGLTLLMWTRMFFEFFDGNMSMVERIFLLFNFSWLNQTLLIGISYISSIVMLILISKRMTSDDVGKGSRPPEKNGIFWNNFAKGGGGTVLKATMYAIVSFVWWND